MREQVELLREADALRVEAFVLHHVGEALLAKSVVMVVVLSGITGRGESREDFFKCSIGIIQNSCQRTFSGREAGKGELCGNFGSAKKEILDEKRPKKQHIQPQSDFSTATSQSGLTHIGQLGQLVSRQVNAF